MPKRPEVQTWLKGYDNPQKRVVERVREIILAADPRIDECIKWKTPTFTFEGNLASFNPRSKTHASLLFHNGAQIPGHHPRLEGTGDTARTMKIASVEEAEQLKPDLEAIVRAWITLKGSTAGAKKSASRSVPKKATTSKAAPKKAAPKKAAPKKAAPKKRK